MGCHLPAVTGESGRRSWIENLAVQCSHSLPPSRFHQATTGFMSTRDEAVLGPAIHRRMHFTLPALDVPENRGDGCLKSQCFVGHRQRRGHVRQDPA